MKNSWKKIGDKALHNDSLGWTFLRSIFSSQVASWVDMLLSFGLFSLFDLKPWFSTAVGAIAGGVINCVINYRLTFHAQGVSWKAVIVKYTMVWLGSVALNSLGTELLYKLLSSWTWLETIGFKPDGYFATARLAASLIVSWAWNFLLQRYFVYRTTRFDRFAISFANIFDLRARKAKV